MQMNIGFIRRKWLISTCIWMDFPHIDYFSFNKYVNCCSLRLWKSELKCLTNYYKEITNTWPAWQSEGFHLKLDDILKSEKIKEFIKKTNKEIKNLFKFIKLLDSREPRRTKGYKYKLVKFAFRLKKLCQKQNKTKKQTWVWEISQTRRGGQTSSCDPNVWPQTVVTKLSN